MAYLWHNSSLTEICGQVIVWMYKSSCSSLCFTVSTCENFSLMPFEVQNDFWIYSTVGLVIQLFKIQSRSYWNPTTWEELLPTCSSRGRTCVKKARPSEQKDAQPGVGCSISTAPPPVPSSSCCPQYLSLSLYLSISLCVVSGSQGEWGGSGETRWQLLGFHRHSSMNQQQRKLQVSRTTVNTPCLFCSEG